MASSIPSFTGPGGVDAATHILNLAAAARPTTADLLYAGQRQKSRIVQRTLAGKDVDGLPFAPYSESYRKRKAKAGHATTVNLFGTENHPHMMNRIVVLVGTADLLQLAFQGEESVRARVHNEGATIRTRSAKGGKKRSKLGRFRRGSFKMPRRHFWDASIADVRDMVNDIGQAISARLKSV